MIPMKSNFCCLVMPIMPCHAMQKLSLFFCLYLHGWDHHHFSQGNRILKKTTKMSSRFLLCFKSPVMPFCTDLQFQDGFDNPNRQYRIRLQCNSCREEENVCVRIGYSLPVRTLPLYEWVPNRSYIDWPGDNHLNYQDQCQRCRHVIWVKMIPGHGKPYSPANYGTMILDQEDCGKMMMFEVYGCTPCGYTLGGGWQVKLDNGKIVRDIDLADGNWFPDASVLEIASDDEVEESEEEEEEEGSDDDEEEEDETEDKTPFIHNLSVFFKPSA